MDGTLSAKTGVPAAAANGPSAKGRRRTLTESKCGCLHAVLLAAVLTISARASADTISPPSGFVSASAASGVNQTFTGAGPLTATSSASGVSFYFLPFTTHASAREFLTPTPALIVDVSGSNVFLPGPPATESNLLYQFQVVAPVGASTSVGVPVYARYEIASDFSEGATFRVEGSAEVYSAATVAAYSSICALSTFDTTFCYSSDAPSAPLRFGQTITLRPDVIEYVGLRAVISFVGSTVPSFDGQVIVDPTFAIDPTFLKENPGYSLQFSPGIGDGLSAVPEPATWAMMLTGLCGLGATIGGLRHARPSGAPR